MCNIDDIINDLSSSLSESEKISLINLADKIKYILKRFLRGIILTQYGTIIQNCTESDELRKLLIREINELCDYYSNDDSIYEDFVHLINDDFDDVMHALDGSKESISEE
jgi:hypothetical protein